MRQFVGSAFALASLPAILTEHEASLGNPSIDSDRSAGSGQTRPPFVPAITLAQWSLHRAIFNGDLDPLDFPSAARSLGVSGVEYVNQFYQSMPANGKWVTELSKRCSAEGIRSHLIMCDGEGDLGDPNSEERRRSVDRHKRWLDAAKALGCHSIRVNARSSGTPDEQRKLLVDGLRALCELAAPLGLSVLVENHGAQSSDGVWLARVLTEVAHPGMGSLPDFGNFRRSEREWSDRYAGVRALAPLARAMSAKSYDFDTDGNETTIDYALMIAIARDANYKGAIGIEYEGRRLSEEQGILATKRLLERLLATSSPDAARMLDE
ncbi:MAG: sugar phosphate isomerase/epimerase [Phycisphaerae bacterium]|jgi:L-ribulose-5-phosphate 3-epimerase|nr:sugar phosphate isomerase/epimerase [Phycisphaerae bacterium]